MTDREKGTRVNTIFIPNHHRTPKRYPLFLEGENKIKITIAIMIHCCPMG